MANTEEKLKHNEFPLDHILPVFNLSKKESNFIPTLKIRQKDNPLLNNNHPIKERKAVVKGSTIHSHQQMQ